MRLPKDSTVILGTFLAGTILAVWFLGAAVDSIRGRLTELETKADRVRIVEVQTSTVTITNCNQLHYYPVDMAEPGE